MAVIFRQWSCDFVFCDCLPLCASRSVGRPKHVRVMAGALEGDLFIGPKAEVANTQTHTHILCLCREETLDSKQCFFFFFFLLEAAEVSCFLCIDLYLFSHNLSYFYFME